MSIPPPKLVYFVERAAELRAQGLSWDQVAQKLGRRVRTVHDWRYRYRAFWDQAIALARQEIAHDCGDEALAVVRQLTRSKDENISRAAANRLLEFRPETDTSAVLSPEFLRFIQFLEGLSDDQLDSLLGFDVRHDDRRPESNPAEPPRPAVSA